MSTLATSSADVTPTGAGDFVPKTLLASNPSAAAFVQISHAQITDEPNSAMRRNGTRRDSAKKRALSVKASSLSAANSEAKEDAAGLSNTLVLEGDESSIPNVATVYGIDSRSGLADVQTASEQSNRTALADAAGTACADSHSASRLDVITVTSTGVAPTSTQAACLNSSATQADSETNISTFSSNQGIHQPEPFLASAFEANETPLSGYTSELSHSQAIESDAAATLTAHQSPISSGRKRSRQSQRQ